jgi:nucleoside-diphosphate-sugar epimerase
MRILFTGASSFTGYWFVRELVAAGHEIVAAFRGNGKYSGIRAQRTRKVRELCETRFGCAFGNDAFRALISSGSSFDVLCHHGAQVGDYRIPDFDPYRAAAANLYRLPEVMRALKDRGCGRLVLTGSIFEAGQGAGSTPLRAFNAYGLSKSLTATAAEFYAAQEGITFEKFVIPNPFGPYEEPRFTAYLMRCWLAGETPVVQTPRYVRDNIHVSLLAKAYAGFVGATPPPGAMRRCNPSGYPESQGAFAERVRREVAPRIGRPCSLELAAQNSFAEPPVRINTDVLDAQAVGWSETQAWDEFVTYYEKCAELGYYC